MSEAGYLSSILDDSVEYNHHNGYENDEQSEIHKKDWFGPAIASMARLNQIQASVYNMGFQDVTSLKAPQHVKHKPKPFQQRSTSSQHVLYEANSSEIMSGRNQKDQVSYTDLQPAPPLSSASYQRTAWGSNHSIPELIAQQGKSITKLRPSSAKVQTSKLRQNLRGRPQSAKEPLCSDQEEKKLKPFGVCGQRKNVLSTKPPSRGNANIVGRNHSQGGAWAGPPAGHVLESVEPTQAQACRWVSQPPMVPPSSPEVMSEDNEIIDRCSQTPLLLRRPLPEPIHLSLPSVNDSVDVSRDDGQAAKDDMDTQRLLVQADHFVSQQKTQEEAEKETEKTLISRNTTLPDYGKIERVSSEEELEYLKMHQSKSHRELYKKESPKKHGLAGKRVIHNKDLFTEDDITPVDDEEKVRKGITINVSEQSTSKDHHLDINKQKRIVFLTPNDMEHTYEPLTLVEEKRNDQIRTKKVSENTDKEDLLAKGSVQIREDKNITVDITPRNIGRKVADEVNNFQRKQNSQSSNRKPEKHLVSMVNVEYQEIDTPDTKGGKSKSRKKKIAGEVETMMSQLSEQMAKEDEDGVPVSQILHKSEGEKNYYEMSRSQSRQSTSSDVSIGNNKILDSDVNVFYKTTKTIEFGEDSFQETTSKVAINNVVVSKPKSEVKQRPPKYSSPLLPSTIKHQQERQENFGRKAVDRKWENTETDLESIDETQTGIDELASLLQEAKFMAETSLHNATKSRPPSGKKTSSQRSNSKSRPPSGKKTSSQRSNSTITEHKPKLRPASAGSKPRSVTDISKDTKSATVKAPKRFVYSARTSSSCCRHSDNSSGNKKPVTITSIKDTAPVNTAETYHCKKVQSRMAELGVDVDPRMLERALFAPAGEPLHYEVPGNLPKNPSAGLLSHYKYWLAEDYKRIQLMEKRLAQDDHIRYLQKLAAEKKAKKLSAKETKGKKKKKKKLVRRNSVV